jgi:hypothetical protein
MEISAGNCRRSSVGISIFITRPNARVRCIVRITWTPSYTADAILTVVHKGGRNDEK